MTQNPFEIPQQFRDLADKNVEQARANYNQFMDAMTQAMTAWSAPMGASTGNSGFQAVQEKASKYAKENADAAFALASDLANAKDAQEVLALQTRFAQLQMQAYATQAQELGRLVTEAMQPRR